MEKIIRLTDHYGVKHNYNPKFVKDVQIVTGQRDWCVNIILDGPGEALATILCHTEEEANKKAEEILAIMVSVL